MSKSAPTSSGAPPDLYERIAPNSRNMQDAGAFGELYVSCWTVANARTQDGQKEKWEFRV